ncbi:MAG: MBL fold metallo-hydrolase [Clostridium fessum]
MTEPHTLYVFGTGNATMTRYYNTCFAIRSGEEYFMTDAGGGNGILRILEEMQVPLNRIHHLFVTHEHTDHILGVIWMIRMIGTAIKREIMRNFSYLLPRRPDRHDSDLLPPDTPEEILRPDRRSDPAHPDF